MTLTTNQNPQPLLLRAVRHDARFILFTHPNLLIKGEFNVR